jgi:hypothetical protein
MLRYEKGNKHRPGTYKVHIAEFAEEFVQTVSTDLQNSSRDQENETANLLDELKEALSAASQGYEVVITEQEWTDYLQRRNLSEPADLASTVGRREKQSWRKLAIIIGAYLIKHRATTGEELKVEEAAKKIYEIAKKEPTSDLPAWSTIKDVLTEIRKAADRISIK